MRYQSAVQHSLLVLSGIVAAVLITEALFRLMGFFLIPDDLVPRGERGGRHRLLCLGDSTTYGLGASDPGKTGYPPQLKEILESNVRDNEFDVINVGRPGLNSSQLLNRLDRFLVVYQPDTIVVMIGINDPWNLEEIDIREISGGKKGQHLVLRAETALSKLRVYQFLKLLHVSYQLKKPVQVPPLEQRTLDKTFYEKTKMTEQSKYLSSILRENIAEIKAIAEGSGVNILFMKYHEVGWGNPEEVLNETYEKLKVAVVDNKEVFAEAEMRGLDVTARDGWHPNDLGHLLIARNVYNKMVTLQLASGTPVNMFD